jgi:putative hemolysin
MQDQKPTEESNMRRSIGLIVLALLAVLAMSPEKAWSLANPASVFCVQSGGRSEIRTGPRGQYGVCRLPDGRVVDEWAYYRAMKRKGGSR